MSRLRLVEVAHLSDTGLVRAHNEDRALALPPLLAVADGMGGAKAGEVAAQMTVDALARTGPAPSVELVLEAIADANREIRELSANDPDHSGMGTTVTAALVGPGEARILHVGDSRAYVVRGGTIRQVTDDHSLVGELMRQGQLSHEEAERHPSRNIITRAIGAEPTVSVDQVPLALESGDVLVLCSDGLSTMITGDEIARIVDSATSLAAAVERLVEAALAAGGSDNVTVVLARFGAENDGDGAATGDTGELPPVPADATQEIPAIDGGPRETNGAAATADADEPTVESPPPTPPTAGPKPTRTAAVLESADRPTASRARRIAWTIGAVVLAFGGLGSWIGSRTFFVDARHGADTARVYHGPPVSLLGIDLYSEWADTGVAVAAVEAGDAGALSGDANGQGAAVTRATALVWRFGLPDITPLELPPAKDATPTPTP